MTQKLVVLVLLVLFQVHLASAQVTDGVLDLRSQDDFDQPNDGETKSGHLTVKVPKFDVQNWYKVPFPI